MLKLKLQYFGHLMWSDSLEKTLMLGKIEGRRRWGQQRMRWLDDITDLMDMNLSKLRELVMDREVWHAVVHGVMKNWTTACQASLSITNSWSLLKLMSTKSVMSSNHLILCYSLLLLPSIFPTISVFSNESVLRIRWPKYWSFSYSISPSNEYSGLISFRIDWFDLLAVHLWTAVWQLYLNKTGRKKKQIKAKETIWESQNKGTTVNGILHGSTVDQ